MRQIAEALRDRGLKVWLDEWELIPGRQWIHDLEQAIQNTQAMAVCIGGDGVGPWERPELEAALLESVGRGLPVIPIPLPGSPEDLNLPLFLKRFTWVDLREGITSDGLDRLVWGATGKKPRPRAPRLHNLPFLSLGALFGGREEDLQKLEIFGQVPSQATEIVQAQAIHGFGGIGKTQLAVEYAWRSGDLYSAILFVVADSPPSLNANLAALAGPNLLNLLEWQAQTREEVVGAVLRWLREHSRWLLILDNVDTDESSQAVMNLLPQLTKGHVIITSRRTHWRLNIEKQLIEKLSQSASTTFLLQRTKRGRASAVDDSQKALELAAILDGLPLALEQAGAYIAYHQISFADYLGAWEHAREEVLSWWDGTIMQYPVPLAVTWQKTFSSLGLTSRAILRLTAYFATESIPEELVEKQNALMIEAVEILCGETGEADNFQTPKAALAELSNFSMISRSEQKFIVHRMLQEVLRTRIPPEKQRLWVEKASRMVSCFLPPNPEDIKEWPICDILSAHAAQVAKYADSFGISEPTAQIMGWLGTLLKAKGVSLSQDPLKALALYAEAEPFMRRALSISQEIGGPTHPSVASYLSNLVTLLVKTDRAAEAEVLMSQFQPSDGPEVPADKDTNMESNEDIKNSGGLPLG